MTAGMDFLRKIVHVDMDAFYASVEQREDPNLRDLPVVVGGDPAGRGVVAACSYEARKFGIHSAMSCRRAALLCPDAVFLRPRFHVYKAVSAEIMSLFLEYTDLVEPLSLDEAFLDVTANKKGVATATHIARELRAEIFRRTGLTASAGVSFNKFLAKVASDLRKPNGLAVITPEMGPSFIDALPIRKFHGVGRATEHKMRRYGIRTGAELKRFSRDQLIRIFGKSGNYFYEIAHGLDRRPVVPHRVRKSLGRETTLINDINNEAQSLDILEAISEELGGMLKNRGLAGRTVTLKVKYSDFRLLTRRLTAETPLCEAEAIFRCAGNLLGRADIGKNKIRLLGICISNFSSPDAVPGNARQLRLPFDEE